MNEYTFEMSPWESAITALHPGDTISALQLLTLTEGTDDDTFSDALSLLEERRIAIDLHGLPMSAGQGQTAVRLRMEHQLRSQGKLMQGLEENDPLRIYLAELNAIDSSADIAALARRCADGDENVVQALTDACLPRVTELACELTGCGVLLTDLIQEGNMGLWQAILSYSDGNFEEHRDFLIRHYLAAAVCRQARAGDIGQKLREGMRDYRDADEQLLSQLGRNPTVPEIAEKLHISTEDAESYAAMLASAQAQNRLKAPKETFREEDDQAVEDTSYFHLRQEVSEMLSVLSDKEAELLSLRFGLNGGKPLSPEETGRILNMTPDEVIAAESAALEKLRLQN